MVNSQFEKSRHAIEMDMFEHFDLVEQYAGVCNKALLQNKDRFPFKQILGAAKKAESEQPVEVVISDTAPQEVYVFRLGENGIAVETHAGCADCACVRSWNIETSYLQDVIHNPQAYVENPAKLNWEWMYDI
jgi:hypothetical protein